MPPHTPPAMESPAGEASPPETPKSWRKRHPVLARAILYTCGLALGLGLYLALQERKKDDRAYQVDVDILTLEALSVTQATDPSGRSLEKALDRDFSGRTLPDHVASREARWRAIAYRAQGRFKKAEEALDRAAGLTTDRSCRDAIAIERAYVRLAAKDAQGALDVLGPRSLRPVTDPLHALDVIVRSSAHRLAGRSAEALDVLNAFVESTPETLQRKPTRRAGGIEWTSVGAAAIVFETLAGQVSEDRSLELWTSIHKRAGSDYQTQYACTKAFLAADKRELAAKAWVIARTSSPTEAAKAERADSILASL